MGSAIGGFLGVDNTNQTSPYASPLSGQQGVDQYLEDLNRKNSIYQGQNSLAQALQAQVAGTGPNPAQLQYMKNVQNNIANSQGLIASQRGLNPALAARMGVNAASKANQEASLGSALLQQQQQLGATANLGNLYGQMQHGNLSYLGQQDAYSQGSNKLNYGVGQQNTGINAGLVGGLLNAGGSLGPSFFKSGGGSSAAPSLAGGAGDAGGGGIGAAAIAAHGALIGGMARVPGDSEINDTVPAMLSPGEIVVPRTLAHDPEKAKAFIDHLLEVDKKKKVEYGDVLKSRRKKAA